MKKSAILKNADRDPDASPESEEGCHENVFHHICETGEAPV